MNLSSRLQNGTNGRSKGLMDMAIMAVSLTAFCLCGPAISPSRATAQAFDDIAQEMRIVWGGNQPLNFRGSISIKGGTIELIRNLGLQKDNAGSVVQRNKQEVLILSQSELTFSGADVFVRGRSSSSLVIHIWTANEEERIEHEIALSELQSGTWVGPAGSSGAKIAIERQIHDRLRVDTASGQDIVDCGSVWKLDVSGYRTGLPEGDYLLTAGWSDSRNGIPSVNVEVRIDSQGSFPKTQLEAPVPEKPGAYKLDLALTRPSVLNYWTNAKPMLSRSIECMALQPNFVSPKISGWRPILAIDPVTGVRSNGYAWLTSTSVPQWPVRSIELRELAAFSETPFGEQWNRLMTLSRSTPNVGSVERVGRISTRELMTTDQEGQPQAQQGVEIDAGSWLTLPINGLKSGHPHRLRIEVPTDRCSLLNISIRDHSYKASQNLAVQSSLMIREVDLNATEGSVTHDVLFWPLSDTVSVTLASGREKQGASVGKLILEQAVLAAHPDVTDRINLKDRTTLRSAGLYIDQPLLVDSLAAPREKDQNTDRDFETWATWKAVAERLTQHIELSGGNTLVLTAMAEGSALFPVKTLPTTRWLDRSTFFTDGRSPEGHDFIELLLRYFDQKDLKLILELDLRSDQLQFLEYSEPIVVGHKEEFYQAEIDGETESDGKIVSNQKNISPASGYKPINPLHPKVQSKLSEMIFEVSSRYSHHRSFSGICLRLHADSPLNFSSSQRGFNSTLIEQFAKQNGHSLPVGADERAQLFQSAVKLSYLNWRAQQLNQLYSLLAETLQKAAPGSNLYVNTTRLWFQSNSENIVGDAESAIRNPEQFLLGFGLDIPSISLIDGLVITQGSVQKSGNPLASKVWAWQSAAKKGVKTGKNNYEGALITHHPQAKIYKSIDATSDNGGGQILRIFTDDVLHSRHARQILVDQLHRADLQLLAFGGWYPIWNQDPNVAELLAAVQMLPPKPMQDIDANPIDSPVRIRIGKHEGKVFGAAINNSSIPCTVRLNLEQSSNAEMCLHGGREAGDLVQKADRATLRMQPYDLIVWSCEGEALKVISADYEADEVTVKRILERLEKTENLLALAGEPGAQRVLFQVGGSFENWTDSSRPLGWAVSTLPSTKIEKALELPRSGEACVAIENLNSSEVSAWIQSIAIDIPSSGRLSVRAWLRSSAADNRQPLIRLGLIGRLKNGRKYEESVYYGGPDNASRPLSNDWGRRPAELNVSDIPIDDLVELKVAIDLIGPGKVWVDDVEVVETWLHPDERNYLRGQMLVAKQKLAAGNPLPAEKLLRSPWNEYLLSLRNRSDFDRAASTQPARRTEDSTTQWGRQKSTIQHWRDGMLERWRR